MGKATREENRVFCTFCKEQGKDVIHNPKLEDAGNHVGNGVALGHNIMEYKYKPGKSAEDHPLSIPKKKVKYSKAQAHHLICSETMNNDEWAEICSNFGYDINCKENGIFLPADMRIACQLKIPLHRGNHSSTETNETPNYVDAVKRKIKPVKDAALKGNYCKSKANIIAKLNNISKEIWGYVKNFSWILTSDGLHYKSGRTKGCLGVRYIGSKLITANTKCPVGRQHGITLTKAEIFKEQ